ncbi:hypothetical protein [Reyranella sp. CPCC 100927]|nr:hypothetical protein [Reyranella sp. CPCC 100927]
MPSLIPTAPSSTATISALSAEVEALAAAWASGTALPTESKTGRQN